MTIGIKPLPITPLQGIAQTIIDDMRETISYDICMDTYRVRWDAFVNGDHKVIKMPEDCYPIISKNDPKIATFRALARLEFMECNEITQLRESLARCLFEATGWLFEATGQLPEQVIGYDGWADTARKLLNNEAKK